jgi:hypothetical protein
MSGIIGPAATLRCCCSRRSDALSPELPGGALGDGRDLLSGGSKSLVGAAMEEKVASCYVALCFALLF